MYYSNDADEASSGSSTSESSLDFGLDGLRQRFNEMKEAVSSFAFSKKKRHSSSKGISFPSFMSYLKNSVAPSAVLFFFFSLFYLF